MLQGTHTFISSERDGSISMQEYCLWCHEKEKVQLSLDLTGTDGCPGGVATVSGPCGGTHEHKGLRVRGGANP